MEIIRLALTWEAVEHEGPGCYDEAYLAYLRKFFLLEEKQGHSFFIDPHQDAWSRWTGGEGAPAWTLEKIGIDLARLDPTNHNRYGAATMFTIFFGGNVFAPECRIEGESAQDWLQERYLACMRHVYRRLKNCAAIAGWGVMNEPNRGFIGCRDLALENAPVTQGLSLFKAGFSCPWKNAGVWTDEGGNPRLLRKDHFAALNGKPVNFEQDFLAPFISRFTERIREVKSKTLIFIGGVPYETPPR